MVSVFDDVEEEDDGYIETLQRIIEISGHQWSDDQRGAVFDVLVEFVQRMRLIHLYRLRYGDKPW